jgi:hypothetical protein
VEVKCVLVKNPYFNDCMTWGWGNIRPSLSISERIALTKTQQRTIQSSRCLNSPEECGDKIWAGLTTRIDLACTKKQAKEKFLKSQERYLRPKKCSFLRAPKVNPELWDDLSGNAKRRQLGITRFSTRGFFRAKRPFSFVSIHFATSCWRNKWYRQKEKGCFTEKICYWKTGFTKLSNALCEDFYALAWLANKLVQAKSISSESIPIADVYPSANNAVPLLRRAVTRSDNSGGEYSYTRVLPDGFFLKAIVFTVYEHDYMNICPPSPNYRV